MFAVDITKGVTFIAAIITPVLSVDDDRPGKREVGPADQLPQIVSVTALSGVVSFYQVGCALCSLFRKLAEINLSGVSGEHN